MPSVQGFPVRNVKKSLRFYGFSTLTLGFGAGTTGLTGFCGFGAGFGAGIRAAGVFCPGILSVGGGVLTAGVLGFGVLSFGVPRDAPGVGVARRVGVGTPNWAYRRALTSGMSG